MTEIPEHLRKRAEQARRRALAPHLDRGGIPTPAPAPAPPPKRTGLPTINDYIPKVTYFADGHATFVVLDLYENRIIDSFSRHRLHGAVFDPNDPHPWEIEAGWFTKWRVKSRTKRVCKSLLEAKLATIEVQP